MVSKDSIINILKEIYDPEIPINIYDLGLIYQIDVKDGDVYILMTLTFPGCPMGNLLVETVKDRVKKLEGVSSVKVELTFDPRWTPEMLKKGLERDKK